MTPVRPLTAAELASLLERRSPGSQVVIHLGGDLPFVYVVTGAFSNLDSNLARLLSDGQEPPSVEVLFLTTEVCGR